MARVTVQTVHVEGVQLVGRVSVDGFAGILVEVRLRRHADGSVVVDRLTVEAETGVRSEVLKAIRLPSIRSAVVGAFERSVDVWERSNDSAAGHAAAQVTRALVVGDPIVNDPVARKYPDELLHAFSVEALHSQGSGESTRAHMTGWLIANGHPNANENTARDVMRKARRRGYIGPTAGPGLREVSPGPRLTSHVTDDGNAIESGAEESKGN